MRQDRKEISDELGFVWRVESAGNNDNDWHEQHEKLFEFQLKNGLCLVRVLSHASLGSRLSSMLKQSSAGHFRCPHHMT
jgi:hypothetical protein